MLSHKGEREAERTAAEAGDWTVLKFSKSPIDDDFLCLCLRVPLPHLPDASRRRTFHTPPSLSDSFGSHPGAEMDPELNGTSFASVACSESDGGGVCHLCVAALEQGLGCGWCHDIARCTKRTQCQVSFVNSETQVLFEIFQCSKEQGVRTVRFHQTFPSSSLLNSASASIGKFPKPMVCDGGLTETRTSRNSFTLYSTRLATVSNPPRPSSTCSGTITSSFHRASRPDLGIGGAAVWLSIPPLPRLAQRCFGWRPCRHSTALVVLESGGGGNAACGIMGHCTH